MAKPTKGGEGLFSPGEIVSPAEMIEKFYNEVTSAETAAALLKFVGGGDASFVIISGRSSDDKNLHLLVRMVEGQPYTYVVVGKHDCRLRARVDITLEQVMVYLRRGGKDLPSDEKIEIMYFEKERPHGNQKVDSWGDVKIGWATKLSGAGELVDYVGEDVEEFIDAVEAWTRKLKEENDKRKRLMGSRLIE